MLKTLTFENYRCFQRFDLQNLGRVNLIVGTNNAGKTSVLEAVQILESPGEFGPAWSALSRRGEDFLDESESGRSRQVDVRRLFHGHVAVIDSRILLRADTDRGHDQFTAVITKATSDSSTGQSRLFETFESESDSVLFPRAAALGVRWQNGQSASDINTVVEMTRQGGISLDALETARRGSEVQRVPIRLITASSLSPGTVSSLFDQVVLTAEEDFVIEALRIIEPSIERIATTGTDRGHVACNLVTEAEVVFSSDVRASVTAFPSAAWGTGYGGCLAWH